MRKSYAICLTPEFIKNHAPPQPTHESPTARAIAPFLLGNRPLGMGAGTSLLAALGLGQPDNPQTGKLQPNNFSNTLPLTSGNPRRASINGFFGARLFLTRLVGAIGSRRHFSNSYTN